MIYGLLGKSLGHSWSPQIHSLLGNPSYILFEQEEEELEALFARKDIGGLNITIPYKKTVLPYLTAITPIAEKIGCVNTVVFHKDGRRIGDNTDYYGVQALLDALDLDLTAKSVLILGTGATSETVETVCRDRKAKKIRKLGRKDLPADEDAKNYDVLINCTPVGMYPKTGESLVQLTEFPHLDAVIDVIYNPHRTDLLLQARERGIPHIDGLPMLVRQAVAASEQFLQNQVPKETEEEILRNIRRQTDNIILIGMPGSGKSTAGRALAEKTHKAFVDIDDRITEKIQMEISEFFARKGEEAFRLLEKDSTAEAGKQANQVIATGGGVIKDPDNYRPLAQNGRIYYIQRPLEELATKGRPLSRGGRDTLHRLFEERDPLYRQFSDAVVPMGTIEEIVQWIREDFDAHCNH